MQKFCRLAPESLVLIRREDHSSVSVEHKLSFLLDHARSANNPLSPSQFHSILDTFGVLESNNDRSVKSGSTPPVLKVIRMQRARYGYKIIALSVLIGVIAVFTAMDMRPQHSFRQGVQVLSGLLL